MIFRQITHDDLGCASCLIADENAGVAAVVDPRLDVAAYLELARYMGVRIQRILETHNHAYHVSGHGRLAASTGAPIQIHADGDAVYKHEPLQDGDATAASLLRRHGARRVIHVVDGGVPAWGRLGHRLVRPDRRDPTGS